MLLLLLELLLSLLLGSLLSLSSGWPWRPLLEVWFSRCCWCCWFSRRSVRRCTSCRSLATFSFHSNSDCACSSASACRLCSSSLSCRLASLISVLRCASRRRLSTSSFHEGASEGVPLRRISLAPPSPTGPAVTWWPPALALTAAAFDDGRRSFACLRWRSSPACLHDSSLGSAMIWRPPLCASFLRGKSSSSSAEASLSSSWRW
mmetsp:Transcript_95215/g.171916  ORF Transcript_95215/g.171916 Transcript_95215/m.171916 type:complete len:205 (-) Transcript_95215:306-920(-)